MKCVHCVCVCVTADGRLLFLVHGHVFGDETGNKARRQSEGDQTANEARQDHHLWPQRRRSVSCQLIVVVHCVSKNAPIFGVRFERRKVDKKANLYEN